jgi:TonB family protein
MAVTSQKSFCEELPLPGSTLIDPGRVALAILAALLLASPLFAQTGPLEARFIQSAKTSPFPKLNWHGPDNVTIVIELTVGTDGRASDARILESSGNKLDDEKVRQYFLKNRFVPAVDEAGTPIVSTVKSKYRRQSSRPDPASSGPSQTRVDNEVQRIERMKCKDFVWEYTFMKKAAHSRRLILGEELFQTSLAMFISREHVTDAQIAALSHSVVPAMETSAQACGNKPNEAFFSSVFSPILKAVAAP